MLKQECQIHLALWIKWMVQGRSTGPSQVHRPSTPPPECQIHCTWYPHRDYTTPWLCRAGLGHVLYSEPALDNLGPMLHMVPTPGQLRQMLHAAQVPDWPPCATQHWTSQDRHTCSAIPGQLEWMHRAISDWPKQALHAAWVKGPMCSDGPACAMYTSQSTLRPRAQMMGLCRLYLDHKDLFLSLRKKGRKLSLFHYKDTSSKGYAIAALLALAM